MPWLLDLNVILHLDKVPTTNNEAELIFTYAGPGSTSNTFGLGLYGQELMTITPIAS